MMIKKIYLETDRFYNKEDMSDYLQEVFEFPEYFGRNLDAAYDCLSEVSEDTNIYIDRDGLIEMASDEYAYKVLRMLVDVCQSNPHLKLKLRRIRTEENIL